MPLTKLTQHGNDELLTTISDELSDIESSEEFKSRLTKLYYGG
jgi:hypothetical protein